MIDSNERLRNYDAAAAVAVDDAVVVDDVGVGVDVTDQDRRQARSCRRRLGHRKLSSLGTMTACPCLSAACTGQQARSAHERAECHRCQRTHSVHRKQQQQ